MHKVTMGAVNLDRLEAGIAGASRRRPPSVLQVLDFRQR